ncbi:Mut7-C RNAse domain-containing protein [Candidatus Bathyarchaeota archaeon]|nr:Mut7-C RNAse domain-containing protein [Candidatus Bathyarchaeota archaeon]
MRFILDGMLGKLARWLRMLGHNAKYSNKLDDAKLLEIAKKEHRILLTRDLELYQQANAKGVKAIYVEGTNEAERLALLSRKLGISLDIDVAKSRCPKCNAHVKPVPKEKVADKVENTTFIYYDEFWECPKCGQIYWQGAHWKRIKVTLETAKKLIKNKKG